MDKQDIITQVKQVIEEQQEITIQDPDEVIDIDSFTMMLIITYTEDKFGVKLKMDSLDFDEFKTLNSLAQLIVSQQSQ